MAPGCDISVVAETSRGFKEEQKLTKRHRNVQFVVMFLLGVITAVSGCGNSGSEVVIDPIAARIDARTVLLQMADDSDPQTRSNALEAMASVMPSDRQARGRFIHALGDKSPWIQFAAAMAAGDTALAEAKPTLLEMANKQGPDKRVYGAVIYALYALGDSSHASDLIRLLKHREPEVRANAAMVIGRMGEPSGIDLLKNRLYEEEPLSQWNVMVNIYEAMATLGDTASAMRLERFIREKDMQVRLAAIDAYPRCAPDRARIVLLDMINPREPVRVQVAAAGSLAKLGMVYSRTYDLCIKAAREPQSLLSADTGEPDNMQVITLQRLAAISLGYMDRIEAVDVLQQLLKSPFKPVRVAAAMSIMRLLPQPVTPQIKAQPIVIPDLSVPQHLRSKTKPLPELHSAGAKD